VIGLQKAMYRKFYRRLQGIHKRIYRRMPRAFLEGLEVEKWSERVAEDQREVLRCLKLIKDD